MATSPQRAILLLSCPEQKGIVAAVSDFLYRNDGNIVDADQHTDFESNLFLSREKSLKRKLQELALAFLLEAALGKDRILEIYLNVIEWGPGLYGLRPAARHYFGKEPGALSPKEMAFLVVMIPGPVKYQRSFNEGALSAGLEPLVVKLLAKLRSVDALSEDEYSAALAETLAFRRPETAPPVQP